MTATLERPTVPTPIGTGRLLPAAAAGGACRTLAGHEEVFGRLPRGLGAAAVVDLAERSGLRGRGGAGFPLGRKLRAVAAGRGPAVVVANAAEGEPASGKDRTLLQAVPHLVLDGLQLAAAAVGADHAVLYVHARTPLAGLTALAAERSARRVDAVQVEVVAAADRFLAGEESAVVQHLSGKSGLPTSKLEPVWRRGVQGRPTLVANAETLAHLALVARHGAGWFRTAGTPTRPGTMLVTVSGDVASPGVLEVEPGTPIGALVRSAGLRDAPQAVLVGGYHGSWIPWTAALDLPLSDEGLQPWGASVGAGVLSVLSARRCGLAETARVVRYLAGQSARQCGPCLNGLPALAEVMGRLAQPHPAPALLERAGVLAGLVEGRGACHHPDGSIRLVRSALWAFSTEIAAHGRGTCCG